jgi:hypothetical protein
MNFLRIRSEKKRFKRRAIEDVAHLEKMMLGHFGVVI